MQKTSLLACISRTLGRRRFSNGDTGDIRSAGGAFGKKEKAQEEQYFRQKEREELEQYKRKLDKEKTKSGEGPKKGSGKE